MIRILVPLDGSSAAEESLIHAISIAKTFPAELTLLQVIAEPDSKAGVRTDSIDLALWHRQARTYLDGLKDRYATHNLLIRSEIAEGYVAQTIINRVAKLKPDLLVITRYGRGNAQDFATGGTAQKVVSSVDCSVLLLDPSRLSDAGRCYRRILVTIDDSKQSECALAVATMIAEHHEASLLLLHVIEEPRLPRGMPATRHARELLNEMQRMVRGEAERRLRELAATIPKQITVTMRVLVSRDIALAIESNAEDHDSDLLLLHTRDAGSPSSPHYDSVCQALILYSHRPLFILRGSANEGLASNFRSVHLEEQHNRQAS